MSKAKPLEILYEDDDIVAINKPPRVASVPAPDIPLSHSILGMLGKKYEKTDVALYPLHRLDYETSGVLLLGKHAQNRPLLEGIFHHPDTHKKYTALVKGMPRSGLILKKLPARSSNILVDAATKIKVQRTFPGGYFSLIEGEITTGRRHQIRRHCALIGHPVVLDNRYGDSKFNKKFRLMFRLGRLFLHASEFSFFHPLLKTHIAIKAPLPIDLVSVLKKITPSQRTHPYRY